jgi:hypothetical protein
VFEDNCVSYMNCIRMHETNDYHKWFTAGDVAVD